MDHTEDDIVFDGTCVATRVVRGSQQWEELDEARVVETVLGGTSFFDTRVVRTAVPFTPVRFEPLFAAVPSDDFDF